MKHWCWLSIVGLAVGCTDLSEPPPGSQTGNGQAADAVGVVNENPPPANPRPAAERPADGKGIIGKTTADVVDLKKALAENPRLKVVENRTAGGDPVSFSASAYVSMRSRASTLGMDQAVRLHKAQYDKYPTFEEFKTMMQQNNIEFTMLYPYQKYAYDESKGEIVVLEDPEDKAARYKAAGIPVEE